MQGSGGSVSVAATNRFEKRSIVMSGAYYVFLQNELEKKLLKEHILCQDTMQHFSIQL